MYFKGLLLILTLKVVICLRKWDQPYDYVVVGAGSAGAVVANRLSANENNRVLLLEKGPELADIVAAVPGLAAVMYTTKNADKFPVERQPNMSLGLEDQQMIWVKGKGLGGTSLMNYMVYTHCDKEYYDRMGAVNPGWSYEDVLPFLRQIEKADVPNINTTYRGTTGEVDVTELETRSKLAYAFVEACKDYGLEFLQDYNAQKLLGVGYVQVNTRKGRRCHSAKAFLRDISDRKNLKIITDAHVSKLVIHKTTKRVECVQWEKDGETFEVNVNKEVVLSAGAYASPQILMLSGIGPKEHLIEMGIQVIQDLPVGKILYDHVIYPGLVFQLNDSSVAPAFHDMMKPHSWSKFIDHGQGLLTVPGLTLEALVFAKTNVSTEKIDLADVEFIFTSGSFNSDHGLFIKEEWRISDETFDVMWEPFENKPVWSVWPMLFHPESKGSVKLASLDPTRRPKLYGNYFTDPEGKDMKTMIAAIRMAQDISKMPALARFQSELFLPSLPGCKQHEKNSDGYWECHIRHIANGVWHPTTTCKMGPQTDPTAVVDNRLKVHGIPNLRVADCSIFPNSITGHPNSAAMMVGAKAAAMILEDNS